MTDTSRTDDDLLQDLEAIRKSSANISTVLEQEIIRSRYIMNALASVLEDGLLVADAQTVITVINPVAATMLGLDLSTATGLKLSELYPEAFTADMQVVQREWAIVDSSTGLPKYLDVVVSKLGGSDQDAEWSHVLILRDVTYKKAQEYKVLDLSSFQHSLISSIPVPTFYSDLNGGYLRGSQSFFDFIGILRLKALSKTVESIFALPVARRFKDQRIQSDVIHCVAKTASGDKSVILYKNLLKSNEGVMIGIVGCLVEANSTPCDDIDPVLFRAIDQCMDPVP